QATPDPITINGYAGSIIDANADATTLVIACTAASCSIATPYTVTQGPSTFYMSQAVSSKTLGAGATVTITQDCKLTASNTATAVCKEWERAKISWDGKQTTTTASTVTTVTGTEIYSNTLVVTGGVEKLRAPRATESV
ncbi:hypothetical protein BO71DRAFT_278655, partial [Aspergillus ellipticus CBS 707.79]